MGVHPMGVHLMNVHLTGMYLIGVYFMCVHLIGIDGAADRAFARVIDALSRQLYVEYSFFTIYRVLLIGNIYTLRVVHSCVSLSL
jgi:hypothetical protein